MDKTALSDSDLELLLSANRVFAVDNSGSTSGSNHYWEKVKILYQQFQPDVILFWNSCVEISTSIDGVQSCGCTEPKAFMDLLQLKNNAYDLMITTDGEIIQSDIDSCERILTPEHMTLLKAITIHYIGNELSMNIGLNVIFNRSDHLNYQINEEYNQEVIRNFQDLTAEDIKSTNFTISVIGRIRSIQARQANNSTLLHKELAEFKGEISRLFSKLEHLALCKDVDEMLRTCYLEGQTKEFLNLLKVDPMDIDSIQREKSKVLNYFNSRSLDLNIMRLNAARSIQEEQVTIPAEEAAEWTSFEDPITMEAFHLPGLLVQKTEAPSLITKNTLLKHPFKLLSETAILNRIIEKVENHPIDYETYTQLATKSAIISPYTRASCTGFFVLDVKNMQTVRNNCRVMSQFFGTLKKVPGDLVLWNLVFMYLLYKHKFRETEYGTQIFKSIQQYCQDFSVNITFSHQCQIARMASIEICLWFCMVVAPKECPNSALNVLRSPFGMELRDFYVEVFEKPDLDLDLKVKRWAVWNYLVANKDRTSLRMEIEAQFQNYILHDGQIVLVGGACGQPFPSICNHLKPEVVRALFSRLTNTSKKIDSLEDLVVSPVVCVLDHDEPLGLLTHVKINLKTCRPFVICPVTKLHWKECAGDYEDSFVNLFYHYCSQFKRYPSHYLDLVLFCSRKYNGRVMTTANLKCIEYVKELYTDVMNMYSCEKYVFLHERYMKESDRLLQE